MPNRGTPAKLEGQRVLIYSNGVIWKNPDDGKRHHIGKSRAEAIEFLRGWAADRVGAVRKPRRIPLPTDLEFGPEHLRMYLRAYYYATARATRGGMSLMTRDEFLKIVDRSDGHCELTGIAFSPKVPDGLKKAIWSPSIDRLDVRGGYTFGNCRLVCVCVNIALNEFGADVLMKIARALSPR